MIYKRVSTYLRFLRSMVRVNKGLLSGMWKLTKLPQPAITVFGGTKLSEDHPSSSVISELTQKLAHGGFSIITGGGPGIMKAANLGAMEHSKAHGKNKRIVSIGIGLSKIEQDFNKYTQEQIIQPYFFTRKWLLVRYSVGFVVGPGGFGTLDELSEVLTLIQTHIMPETPIVLIGTKYWGPLLEWVNNCALKEGLLNQEDADLINVTDSASEAFKLIISKCTSQSSCSIDAKPKKKNGF